MFPMRRPIQQQLLIPVLVVVLAGVAVSSIAGAWMGAQVARDQEQNNVRRLVTTLADAGFPLSENVLRKMAGLSGADFALIGSDSQIVHSTIPLSEAEAAQILLLDQKEAGRDVTITLSTGRYRIGRLPIRVAPPRSESQSLYVFYPEEHWDQVARRAAWPPLVAGMVAAVIAVGLTTFLARRFTGRVRQLSEQAAAIAAGSFQATPLPATDDELRDLAAALNQMSEQLGHYEEQIRRSERLRTLGQLGAGIAHQIRNSATGALMALELHSAELPSETDRESLDVALRQLKLMETSLKRFLQLGRGDRLPMQTVDLRQLVDQTLLLVEPACRHARIQLRWTAPDSECHVRGEPDSLRQLLLNLLVNAIEAAAGASTEQGTIRVELDRVATDATLQIRLRVLDSGPGPDPHLAPRLFEPFATSKADGTGLGLSVAQQIAQTHSAILDWSRVDGLTCFEVRFDLPRSTTDQ